MLSYRKFAMVGVSLLSLATPAMAQDAPAPADGDTATGTEIIVEARRKDESVQDVPLVVNAVTADDLQKLNVRDFKDVQNLVPGLSLTPSPNGIGPSAALRGVAFDVNASGNNGTIEFYQNDAPLSAGILFNSMFDIGQIEVLRGPQGTLRGRASPSGSITVTTRRPVLDQAGGYVSGSVNDRGNWNLQAAINVPIISDVLGVRLAGVVDENDLNDVRSINNPAKPYNKNKGGRVTVLFKPTDFITLQGSYQIINNKSFGYDQVESANFADSTLAAAPVAITPSDRLAVQYAGRTNEQTFSVWNWQAEVKFAGQKLNYVGSINKQHYTAFAPNDTGAVFGSTYSATLRGAGQSTDTNGKQQTHEIRLSSDERVAGIFDYVGGFLWNKLAPPTNLTSQTPLFAGFLAPSQFLFLNNTPVVRGGFSLEQSFFGNVTAHLGQFELSGGLRHIQYHTEGFLGIGGSCGAATAPACRVAAANENRTFKTWIWSASAKYRFNDNLMVYASAGSSWRPGSATNPIIMRDVTTPSAALASLYFPGNEKSKSYEIGIKSDWLDKKLKVNITAYHQDFENYAYSSRGVIFGGPTASAPGGAVLVASPALAVGVPAKVDGVEAELAYAPSSRFNIAASVSYSKSKIKNGVIPCNDYSPRDGNPDATVVIPNYATLNSVTSGANVSFCTVNYRAGIGAPFVATVQAEYSVPVTTGADGYLRGFVNYQGDSQNDPANRFDDIPAYALVNLYAGVRDPDGAWEIGGYVKNVFDVERVTSRGLTPLTASYVALTPGPVSGTALSAYRGITMTPPREFGVQATIKFGSR